MFVAAARVPLKKASGTCAARQHNTRYRTPRFLPRACGGNYTAAPRSGSPPPCAPLQSLRLARLVPRTRFALLPSGRPPRRGARAGRHRQQFQRLPVRLPIASRTANRNVSSRVHSFGTPGAADISRRGRESFVKTSLRANS
jgi:hypothetical protein